MENEKLFDLRFRVKHRLKEYLQAAGLRLEESDLENLKTTCPFCGQVANVLTVPLEQPQYYWTCPYCKEKGDAIRYAMAFYKLTEEDAILHVSRLLGERITFLLTFTATEVMQMEFPPAEELVSGILSPGLYILAGAPKAGKSWLVLQVAHCTSVGLPLWDRNTQQCDVLYLCLEDNEQRIQRRLYRLCGGETGNIFFSTKAGRLDEGFEEQVSSFLNDHPNTKLVIVDTLAVVRGNKFTRNAYADDYATMTILKNLAQRFGVVVLVVHHTRKQESSDIMAMISGTNGLMGCADGAMVLERPEKLSGEAFLNITGRDCEDARLHLRQNKENMCWEFIGYGDDTQQITEDPVLCAVEDLVHSSGTWRGTAVELVAALTQIDSSLALQPNSLSRKLNARAQELQNQYGVRHTKLRNAEGKYILLQNCVDMSDMSDELDNK